MRIDTFFIPIFAVFGITSCYKEPNIVPQEEIADIRFQFPQGDAPYDLKLNKIFEDLGVKVIYTDMKVNDWLRYWTLEGNSNVSMEDYYAEYFQKDTLVVLVDYLNEKFFKYLPNEVASQVFNPYIYLLKGYGYNNNLRDPITGEIKLVLPTRVKLLRDGLDFWIISPDVSQFMTSDPVLEKQINFYAKSLLFAYMGRSYAKGLIKEPTGFFDGLDFVTPITNDDASKANNDPNYYLNRGIIESFHSGNFDSATPDFTRIPVKPATYSLNSFKLNYLSICVQMALFYTEDEYTAAYGKYPKVMEKYKLLTDYFLKEYSIDLKAMAAMN